MDRYALQKLSFEPPNEWIDETVARFRGPASDGGPCPTIFVGLESLSEGENLETLVARKIVSLARQVEGFELVGSTETQVGGRRAVRLEIGFTNKAAGGERVIQNTVLVDAAADPDRKVVALSMATAAPFAEQSQARFAALLESVRFAEQPTPSPQPKRAATEAELAPAYEMPMPGFRTRA